MREPCAARPNGARAVRALPAGWLPWSLQTPEIREHRVQLVAAELDRRHLVARLQALRVEDPAGEVARRVADGAGADVTACRGVGQVGTDLSQRRCAGDRVAVRAGARPSPQTLDLWL